MADEDPAYTDWIRSQPCEACGESGPCRAHHHTNGPTISPWDERSSEEHLPGARGLKQRAHDHFTMPLHDDCHIELHQFLERFAKMNNAQRRAWQDDAVARMWKRFGFGEDCF